ncbi:hypothetical protein PVAP13_2KG008800 [Panicum virgatum]|uniref:BSD domain-containing protein n=2 Tax=Panicum virgatum TaxID=38727 RepID=A0A8T0VWQ4_PANVG|nr:hypothetical protein PVAP13_2KG008800 [Panicum virgatum]
MSPCGTSSGSTSPSSRRRGLRRYFDMTEAQQDNALAVESLASELADLRIELCPSHTSEGCFLKIHFVLLHPISSRRRMLRFCRLHCRWYGWR